MFFWLVDSFQSEYLTYGSLPIGRSKTIGCCPLNSYPKSEVSFALLIAIIGKYFDNFMIKWNYIIVSGRRWFFVNKFTNLVWKNCENREQIVKLVPQQEKVQEFKNKNIQNIYNFAACSVQWVKCQYFVKERIKVNKTKRKWMKIKNKRQLEETQQLQNQRRREGTWFQCNNNHKAAFLVSLPDPDFLRKQCEAATRFLKASLYPAIEIERENRRGHEMSFAFCWFGLFACGSRSKNYFNY